MLGIVIIVHITMAPPLKKKKEKKKKGERLISPHICMEMIIEGVKCTIDQSTIFLTLK